MGEGGQVTAILAKIDLSIISGARVISLRTRMGDRDTKQTRIRIMGTIDLTRSLGFINQAVSKDGWVIDTIARTSLSRLYASLMPFHLTPHSILITTPSRLNLAKNPFLMAEVPQTRKDHRLVGLMQLHIACQMKFRMPALSMAKVPPVTCAILVHKSQSGLAR